MKSKYMMATTAIHKMGDISRDTPDLCIIHKEDEENYIGNWITGFGFVDVKFPKSTTRELTTEEIEKWHGKMMFMSGTPTCALNLKNENFQKEISLTKDGENKTREGTLQAPVKVGNPLFMIKNDGYFFQTTTIQKIEGNKIHTKNSTYNIEYVS